jgi:eukaryotic-like serine/threonine-protein kinase
MYRASVSYRFDEIVLNPETFSVEKGGRALALEPKSIRLLHYLIQNRSRAVGKDELLSKIWQDVAVTENALARVVAQLRKALGDDAKVARYIETVPTIGYRFVADVTEVNPAATVPASIVKPEPAPRNGSRWVSAWLAVALLVVIGAALLRERSRPVQEAIWSGTALGGSMIASHPRISPDGQLLAFRAIIDNLSQVAVMKPDSSSWTALTNDHTGGAVSSVAWSHDGSRIYFDREWEGGKIYSIGPLGGTPRLVLENAWVPEPLPDGSIVAERLSAGGREQLIRFWPDSGRTQVLPATILHTDAPRVRVFPDGREIAVFGNAANAPGPHRFFVLNLQTLAIRYLNVGPDVKEPLAVTADAVLMERRREDTIDIIAAPRSGSGPVKTLLSLPFTTAPISLDAAADGSLYMDHSGFARSILIASPSGTVLEEIPVPEVVEHSRARAVVGLPERAFAFAVGPGDRSRLYVARHGAEPQPLLNSPEAADLPGAYLTGDNLAFIVGMSDRPRMAIASLHDGRIVQRFPQDARRVTAISATADGRTIYYADNGVIWAQAVAGGEPRRVGEGFDVAVDPAGQVVYAVRAGAAGNQLFRMPAAGGEATRVPLPTGFDLSPLPLWSSAVDRQGRVLLQTNVPDVFFFQAALLNPARNTMTRIPVPARVVVVSAGWTLDGNIWAVISRWSANLWRYRAHR